MILYGTRTFIRVKGVSTSQHACGRCGLRTHFELQHVWRWVTLFFIPIFPFWVSRGIRCPHCGSGIPVKKHNEHDMLNNLESYLDSDRPATQRPIRP